MTPDLDNPVWQLLLIAALLWIGVALLWLHDRAKYRRTARRRASLDAPTQGVDAPVDDPRRGRVDARHGRVRNDQPDSSGGTDQARAEGLGVRQVRPEQPRLLGLRQRQLTDDDVVTLARFLTSLPGYDAETAAQRLGINITPVRRRIQSAASDIVNAERVGRRPDVSRVMRRMSDR